MAGVIDIAPQGYFGANSSTSPGAMGTHYQPGAEEHGGGGSGWKGSEAGAGAGWHGGRADPSLPFSGTVATAPIGLPNGGGPEAGVRAWSRERTLTCLNF